MFAAVVLAVAEAPTWLAAMALAPTLRAADLLRPARRAAPQAYREGMEDQLSALGLALNATVLWNTLYSDHAVKQLAADGLSVTDELLALGALAIPRRRRKLTAILTAAPACGTAREATAADGQHARHLRYGRRRTLRWRLRCKSPRPLPCFRWLTCRTGQLAALLRRPSDVQQRRISVCRTWPLAHPVEP